MEVGFKTDKGIRRSNNEDAFFVMKKDRVFIVADGVGGNRSGEIASRTTVNSMAGFVEEHPVEALKTEDEIRDYFLDCISDANQRVRDVARWHKRNRGDFCPRMFDVQDNPNIAWKHLLSASKSLV